MSITITINDINNLTDMERTLLRLVADNSVAASLKEAVRKLTPFEAEHNAPIDQSAPIDPPEVLSPHVQVINPFAVPAPVPAPIPTVPASAELDAQGFPWDKRIHSSSRAKLANGNWRYARNLDGSIILAVEAELRATMGAPQATALLTPQAQDAAAVEQDRAPAPVAVAPAVPLPPIPTIPTPPVPAPVSGEVTTFAQLMQRITPHIVSTKLSQAHIQVTCASLGLPHLAALGARPDLIPAALVALESGVTA